MLMLIAESVEYEKESRRNIVNGIVSGVESKWRNYSRISEKCGTVQNVT